jgi:glutamate formiminotransferase
MGTVGGELLECVPNFSEGRDCRVVDEIVAAMAAVSEVRVLDREMDANHNRSVVTLAGPPDAVARAAFQGVGRAAELIDMTRHTGQHPRIGAADVVPLVPLAGVTMAACVALARRLGRRIGEELGLPVYMYGEAALRPERRDLPNLRKGEYEGLAREIATEPSRHPDFGPAVLGSAGAVAVGARAPLVAFNVNLHTADLAVARAIARAVRESSGGLPCVRAIGLALPDLGAVQVSMNLTDFSRTSMAAAYAAVAEQARQRGITVRNSEIVGLVPAAALPLDAERALCLRGFTQDQILEHRLATVR